jgi:hypothetical protein
VQETQRDPPRRVWRVVPEKEQPTAPAWVVGRIVHGALEHWLFSDAPDLTRWAAAEARSCGITDEAEIRDAVRRAVRMLDRFQATALHATMETAIERIHEVPYSLASGKTGLEYGVIDALFRSSGEGWTLVEFKTDYVEDRTALDSLLAKTDRDAYVPQVARYLDAAESLLSVRPRPVLCFLNYVGRVYLVRDRW